MVERATPQPEVPLVSLTLITQGGSGLRLKNDAVAVPALTSQVRPALVLPELQARALLDAAAREDVSDGGGFSAGPAGIQLWSGPFNGPEGSRGTSTHL